MNRINTPPSPFFVLPPSVEWCSPLDPLLVEEKTNVVALEMLQRQPLPEQYPSPAEKYVASSAECPSAPTKANRRFRTARIKTEEEALRKFPPLAKEDCIPHFVPRDTSSCPLRLTSFQLPSCPFLLNNLEILLRFKGLGFCHNHRFISIHVNEEHPNHSCLKAELNCGQEDVWPALLLNDEAELVLFRDASILCHSGRNAVQQGAHLKVLDHYERLINAGIPVTPLLNGEDLKRNCGYFLTRKARERFALPWQPGASYHHLDWAQKKVLNQIASLFKTLDREGLAAPLPPDCLGIDKDGTLILLDFMPPADLELDEIPSYLRSRLRLFDHGNEGSLFEYLTHCLQTTKKRLPNSNPQETEPVNLKI